MDMFGRFINVTTKWFVMPCYSDIFSNDNKVKKMNTPLKLLFNNPVMGMMPIQIINNLCVTPAHWKFFILYGTPLVQLLCATCNYPLVINIYLIRRCIHIVGFKGCIFVIKYKWHINVKFLCKLFS